VAVLNADDPLVAAMATRTNARVVTFGRRAGSVIHADNVTVDASGRASFYLCTPQGQARVQLSVHGGHQVPNALAAPAVALCFTDDVALVAQALSAAEPVSPGRMHVTHRPDGITIVDDAYNANPASMTAAFTALTTMASGRRMVAVLGQMNELGDTSAAEHVRVGEAVTSAGVALLVAVGNDDAGHLAAGAAHGAVEVLHVADRHAAAEALAGRLMNGDVVLVKGSNSVGLMALAERLAAAPDHGRPRPRRRRALAGAADWRRWVADLNRVPVRSRLPTAMRLEVRSPLVRA
jgi:UDP-N-acetylmuramoyl-tripeptide--D-alanyl-D-alanine ligase